MNRPLLMSIAAVERDTGLSKDTLRVWEKRYGFPAPERDAQGERCYPMDQIERLRVIKRLLDVGHRPGRVVTLPMVDLGALASRSADAQHGTRARTCHGFGVAGAAALRHPPVHIARASRMARPPLAAASHGLYRATRPLGHAPCAGPRARHAGLARIHCVARLPFAASLG
jgi:hypothetical protein